VAVNPHARNGETFAFLKKQSVEKEAPFIIHFEEEPVHSNLSCTTEKVTPNASHSSITSDNENPQPEQQHTNESCYREPHRLDLRLQHVAQRPEKSIPLQWATSKKSGRPHAQESWELELKKGEQVEVIQDMGRDWFVVMDKRRGKGWAHGSWLDFGNRRVHADAKHAYKQFEEDLGKALVPGQLCSFPTMTSYVLDACTKAECQPLREDISLLGICVHDLLALLEGSGRYSYEWLKEGRNCWHPDRFARFCHPGHADRLKPMAEQMFVMYGMLMEVCRA
jgi:methylenetetrahydrofolate dehydrogenase (NADP+)/methenyltetrahydrofolate cyclohydrolase/formyltetrahydrofolate synthetase